MEIRYSSISIIIVLLLFSFKSSKAQKFTGEIIYKTSIIPKTEYVNVDSIRQALTGDKTHYIISDSLYKSSYYKNGEFDYSFTYDSENKRMYDYRAGSSYITYRDSRKPSDDAQLDLTIYRDSTIMVLGHESYLTVNKTYEFESSTYYSDDIRINYSAFKGHEVGNWYERLLLTDGAISLKSITDKGTYIEVIEAVQINRKVLEPKNFNLPEGLPVIASYSALDKRVELSQPTPNQIRCYQKKVSNAPDIIKNEDRVFNSIVEFVVTKNGKIEFIKALEKDEYDIYKIALDIMNTCNLNFKPGEINGQPVDSQTYLPIQFQI